MLIFYSDWATSPIYLDSNADRIPDYHLLDMGADGNFRLVQQTLAEVDSGVVGWVSPEDHRDIY